MSNFTKILVLSAITMVLSACSPKEPQQPSADQVQRRQQEQLSAQGVASVGMPSIVNFQEKRIMKDIIEMRDKAIVTVTYTQDMSGGLHKLCDSIGFGIPAATQYTSPTKEVVHSYGQAGLATSVLAQADPNGLFSPASAEGTWVMCKDPASSKVAPVYIEPRIIVSPFSLK